MGTITIPMSLLRTNKRVATMYRILYIPTSLTDLKTLIGLISFITFTNTFKIEKRCIN